MKPFGFPKEERLCGKRPVDTLFREGKRLHLFPFRLVYSHSADVLPEGHLVRILISVPKRIFRKAHDRNHLKRQIREAWRLSRNSLLENISGRSSEIEKKALHIAFLYQSDKKEDWPVLLEAMEKAVRLLSKKVQD